MKLSYKIFFLAISLFTFSNCPAPSVSGNFIIANPLNKKPAILPENVVIFREALPPGIKRNFEGNYEVDTKFQNKIELIGKIELRLQNGIVLVPGFPFQPYFIKPEEEGIRAKYCRNNPLIFLPVPIFNIINPLGWPCFGLDNYAGNTPEAEQYREKIREELIRQKAAENGANLVFIINSYSGIFGMAQAFLKNNIDQNAARYTPNLDKMDIYGVYVSDKSYFKTK
ncbi:MULTISPECIES: hypothetical protein [unclassified Leptospira]|uniref:hypothetical protein n=1 Tax=unclassified Leptospira TaxID=2633828 RepID=UPI0002BEA15E|nr:MULTISPECIES: hypothetical protein [unclassified Leptospira]EMJ97200.1 hypothetical protein LEP1GSC192_3621 [Leptospira sp. B5-022]MCR1795425.1 hypothetical protein [Leptospira sp. id769339]